jgi:RNA 3'-terminal phosphate cyclase (ATP)
MEVGYQNCTEVFASNGDIGTSCEKVARDLWGEARKYLASDIPIGPYLADQLILPLGIAASRGETSVFRTSRLTQHSTTHIDLIKQFLPISVDVTPQEERSCLVTIRPA